MPYSIVKGVLFLYRRASSGGTKMTDVSPLLTIREWVQIKRALETLKARTRDSGWGSRAGTLKVGYGYGNRTIDDLLSGGAHWLNVFGADALAKYLRDKLDSPELSKVKFTGRGRKSVPRQFHDWMEAFQVPERHWSAVKERLDGTSAKYQWILGPRGYDLYTKPKDRASWDTINEVAADVLWEAEKAPRAPARPPPR